MSLPGLLGAALGLRSRAPALDAPSIAGLPSLNVTALATKDGSLFVGTDNGLVRLCERKTDFVFDVEEESLLHQ